MKTAFYSPRRVNLDAPWTTQEALARIRYALNTAQDEYQFTPSPDDFEALAFLEKQLLKPDRECDHCGVHVPVGDLRNVPADAVCLVNACCGKCCAALGWTDEKLEDYWKRWRAMIAEA